MCGIVGFTGAPHPEVLHAMNTVQAYRGPDDEGYLTSMEYGVSLGIRRLAIIDLQEGRQPMRSPDGNNSVVFNGEIFNAPELRATLERGGHRFTTHHSDTEVLLHLYAVHGEEMVHHLNGMFAFVIFDRARRRLFGARDRFGIKPLYLSTAGNRLAFASELKALLTAPWIPKTLSLQALFDYLSLQSVPAPRSIFVEVEKLQPAHRFTYDLTTKALSTQEYWRPRFAELDTTAPREIAGIVRTELERAVELWSRSDVPVACSLSGGVDSSAITAVFASLLGKSRLRTFTLGFEDAPHLDERDLAGQLAARWGTEHHEIILKGSDLLGALDDMVWHLDEPYSGGLPSWFVFKAIGEEVKVALTGVGGDELFGNYQKWLTYESPRHRLSRRLGRSGPPGFHSWPRGSLYTPMYLDDETKREGILETEVAHGCRSTESFIEDLWVTSHAGDPRRAITSIDLRQQLPNEFLHMVDRFSMAHSVEARTPLLDHLYVEKVLAIPPRLRSPRNSVKGVFLDATRDLLPDDLVLAPKRGFVIPMARWLREDLRDRVVDLLNPGRLREQHLFRRDVWDRWVATHLDGREDNHLQVWTLLMFQIWHERFAPDAAL